MVAAVVVREALRETCPACGEINGASSGWRGRATHDTRHTTHAGRHGDCTTGWMRHQLSGSGIKVDLDSTRSWITYFVCLSPRGLTSRGRPACISRTDRALHVNFWVTYSRKDDYKLAFSRRRIAIETQSLFTNTNTRLNTFLKMFFFSDKEGKVEKKGKGTRGGDFHSFSAC